MALFGVGGFSHTLGEKAHISIGGGKAKVSIGGSGGISVGGTPAIDVVKYTSPANYGLSYLEPGAAELWNSGSPSKAWEKTTDQLAPPEMELPPLPEADYSALEEMTPLDKEVAAISGEQWNRYVTTYQPFEEKVMADVAANDDHSTQTQSAINANLMQKQSSTGDFASAMGRRTGAIGSVRATRTGNLAQAASRGAVEGSEAQAVEKAAMTQNLVELGRGGADFAASGLGEAASQATQRSISDWNYQFGQEKLDVQQQMNQSALSTAQYVQTQNYLTDLFASAAGVAAYASPKIRAGVSSMLQPTQGAIDPVDPVWYGDPTAPGTVWD